MPDSEPTAEAAADAAAVEAAEEEVEEVVPDTVREEILADLQRRLGESILASEIAGGDLWVRVDRSAWRQAGEACKAAGFDYFCFLSGIDWLPNPSLSGRAVWDMDGAAAEEEPPATDEGFQTGVAGGTTRFQVFARVYSVARHVGLTLKADLDDAEPSVESWTTVYRGADWHEREAWEMYGFDFVGHPGLRHLYLPMEFEGHPLRKDFPLLAREVKPWPGIVDKEPIPGEADEEEAPAEEAT